MTRQRKTIHQRIGNLQKHGNALHSAIKKMQDRCGGDNHYLTEAARHVSAAIAAMKQAQAAAIPKSKDPEFRYYPLEAVCWECGEHWHMWYWSPWCDDCAGRKVA